MQQSRSGFSLVEIAIALTVIAILAAAISKGQDIIENARLTKLIGEIDQVKTSVKNFTIAYEAMPGDYIKATSVFGSSVENGDANGVIDYQNISSVYEHSNAILHMQRAEMLPDQGGTTANHGANYQLTSFSEASLRLFYLLAASGNAHANYDYFGDPAHLFQIGTSTNTNGALLVPNQAKKVDLKIDDGLPKSGYMTFRNIDDSTDADCTGESTEYLASASEPACNIVLRLFYF